MVQAYTLWASLLAYSNLAFSLVHPGLLHTDADFERVTQLVESGAEPWATAWTRLTTVSITSPVFSPNPIPFVDRGGRGRQTYGNLLHDASAAYKHALVWKISGNDDHADTTIRILNAWGPVLEHIGGSTDRALAAGLYGYQLANAAEIVRDYEPWNDSDKEVFTEMLNTHFLGISRDFLIRHNNVGNHHYWANWDLCSAANVMAVGVFTDNATTYEWAREFILDGWSQGALPQFIIESFEEEGSGKRLVQGQEAGRDQGHATLDISLLGVVAQQAWNQGDDIFGARDNAILAAAEYVAKYNLGNEVPYVTYDSLWGPRTQIGAGGRGNMRPGFELIYAHYAQLQGLNASWTMEYRDKNNARSYMGVEWGGGDDSGLGTLMYRLPEDASESS